MVYFELLFRCISDGSTLVSILVLMDGVLRVLFTMKNILLCPCFNPCSNGWCTSSREALQQCNYKNTVSILVLMDGVLRVNIAVVLRIFDIVSILVLMDGVLRAWFSESSTSKQGVSILVLMDGVLRAAYSRQPLGQRSVSILVLMDGVLREGVPGVGALQNGLFQSLF